MSRCSGVTSLCTASVFSEGLNIFTISKYTQEQIPVLQITTTEAKIIKFTTGTVKQNVQAKYLATTTDTLSFLVITKNCLSLQCKPTFRIFNTCKDIYVRTRYCSVWLTESWRGLRDLLVCLSLSWVSICNLVLQLSSETLNSSSTSKSFEIAVLLIAHSWSCLSVKVFRHSRNFLIYSSGVSSNMSRKLIGRNVVNNLP